jgi:hypothetical protein
MLLQLGDALPGFGLRKITQQVTSPVTSSSSSSSIAGSWTSSNGSSQLPYAYAGATPAAPTTTTTSSSGGGSSGSPGVLRRLAADKLQAHATAAAQQAVAMAGDVASTLLPPAGQQAPVVPPGAAARVVNKAVFGLGLLGVWGLELSGWWVQPGKDNWSSQVRHQVLLERPNMQQSCLELHCVLMSQVQLYLPVNCQLHHCWAPEHPATLGRLTPWALNTQTPCCQKMLCCRVTLHTHTLHYVGTWLLISCHHQPLLHRCTWRR